VVAGLIGGLLGPDPSLDGLAELITTRTGGNRSAQSRCYASWPSPECWPASGGRSRGASDWGLSLVRLADREASDATPGEANRMVLWM